MSRFDYVPNSLQIVVRLLTRGTRPLRLFRIKPLFVCIFIPAALLWPVQPQLAPLEQQTRLFGSGAVGASQQGNAVALSADGTTAIVGGPSDNGGIGAVWIFARTGSTWGQQAKLVGTGAIGNASQGFSVALSADGNTAIVGGPNDNSSAGAAWVFTRSGATWSQQARLVGPSAIGNASQGWSVALSADGNTAIMGGISDNGNTGAAWVFTRSGAMWGQQAKLVGNAAIIGAPRQGFSVALSSDGDTAIVGGPFNNGGFGAAWVFVRSGGVLWSEQAALVGTGAVGNPSLGFSVALSSDGNTAMVGGPTHNSNAGGAWVFVRISGQWSEQVAGLNGIFPAGAAQQGFSVALSADGNTAFVGGPFDNNNAGAVWVWIRQMNGVWIGLINKLVGTGAAIGGARQGSSLALSCNVAMVGGPSDNGSAGAAWVFATPPNNPHDFNGDCTSDIVWWNRTSGQVVIWEISGGFFTGAFFIGGGSPGSMPSPWTIVGQRDFNGDGLADILWRNGSTGQTTIWLLSGASIIRSGSPGTVMTDWIVAGTGDFNGDGMGDILWYNIASGQVVLWFLNGTSVIGGGSPGSAPSPWAVVGAGDFNGDGFADILWYNPSTGQALIWFMNGASVVAGASPGTAPSPWKIAATGDFDGDGNSDLLWYNTTNGQVVIWLLNGGSIVDAGSPGAAASPWALAETGDFNGDGRTDLLWVNAMSGQVVLWFLIRDTVFGGGSPGSAMSPWQVQGLNSD